LKKIFCSIAFIALATLACGGDVEFQFELCGNWFLNPMEACDDGNYVAGDGCSPRCQIEEGWHCIRRAGQSSVCYQKECTPGKTRCVNEKQSTCSNNFVWSKALACDKADERCDENLQACKNGVTPPPNAELIRLSPESNKIRAGAKLKVSVELNRPAETELYVSNSIDKPELADVRPAKLRFNEGETRKIYEVQARADVPKNASFTVTSSYGGKELSADFTLILADNCIPDSYKCDRKEGGGYTRFKCGSDSQWVEDECERAKVCVVIEDQARCINRESCNTDSHHCVQIKDEVQAWNCVNGVWNKQSCEETSQCVFKNNIAKCTTMAKLCDEGETKCELAKLYTCDEHGAWNEGEYCNTGQSCIEGKNSCEYVKLKKITAKTNAVIAGRWYDGEVELEHPIYQPNYEVTINEDAISTLSFIIDPQPLVFNDAKSKVPFKFQVLGTGIADKISLIARGPADENTGTASVELDYSTECFSLTNAKRCLSYLRQVCDNNGFWKSAPCGAGSVCVPFGAGIVTCEPVDIKPSTHRHFIRGKRHGINWSYAPSLDIPRELSFSDPQPAQVILEPAVSSAVSHPYLKFDAGVSVRTLSLVLKEDDTRETLDLSYNDGIEQRQLQLALIPCTEGMKRCENTSDASGKMNVSVCDAQGNWAEPSERCADGTVCSLFSSDCVDPGIQSVFPSEFIVDFDANNTPTVTVDLNQKLSGTLTIASTEATDQVKTTDVAHKSRVILSIDRSWLRFNDTASFNVTFTDGSTNKTSQQQIRVSLAKLQ
jgi:cysteine-rich repeat protein